MVKVSQMEKGIGWREGEKSRGFVRVGEGVLSGEGES